MGELIEQLRNLLEFYQYSPAMSAILQSIVDGTWTSIKYKEILAENGIRSNSVAFKEESLDVALQYARLCLEDDALSDEEIKGMNMLKRMLFIEEGDFYKYGRRDAVEGLIAAQLYKVYDDDFVSYAEAVHKVELQGLFNLSYEQFEDIVQEIAQAALERGANFLDLDTYSVILPE